MRTPLCTYYSSDRQGLLQEIQAAYAGSRQISGSSNRSLLALVVPHGAACDGFHVAASAYCRLNAHLRRRRCRHLTAVLLGTEHRGTTPLAASRVDWATPLGVARVDTAAVDFLCHSCSASHGISVPVDEAPHAAEHSLENQLPFLLHGTQHGWDLAVAGCQRQPGGGGGGAGGAAQAAPAAQLSIVPISVGYLGGRPGLVGAAGAAVRQLLQHLRRQAQQQQQAQCAPSTTAPPRADEAAARHAAAAAANGDAGGGEEVVLIVTSDFTHAGPFYRELPPLGVSLQDYMRTQDTPVLEAVQHGSSSALLAAAAATRNSMCGLYPLAVALEALYGEAGSGGSGDAGDSAGPPVLVDYRPAHAIFPRPDSTGFAAFVVYSRC